MGLVVHAVDNAASVWRTVWIDNTIVADGIKFLQNPPAPFKEDVGNGGESAVLLLVYPQVTADFTRHVIQAYKGDVIAVAGTQNGNGFTGFRDETIADWMNRERPEFEKVVQIPLPSFAAKDEALYIFTRRP
jgi:hypothetical protein